MLHPSHGQEKNQTRLQWVPGPALHLPSRHGDLHPQIFTQPPGTHKELEAEALAPKQLTFMEHDTTQQRLSTCGTD